MLAWTIRFESVRDLLRTLDIYSILHIFLCIKIIIFLLDITVQYNPEEIIFRWISTSEVQKY